MIFSQVLATPFLSYVLKIIEKYKQRRNDALSHFKYLNTILDSILHVGRFCQHFLPLLSQLHLAIFYVNGRFYEFSKRISGINYVSNISQLSNYYADNQRKFSRFYNV